MGVDVEAGELGVVIIGCFVGPVSRAKDEGTAERNRRRGIGVLFQADETTGVNDRHLRRAGIMLRLVIDTYERRLTLGYPVKGDGHGGGDDRIGRAQLDGPTLAGIINRRAAILGLDRATKRDKE